ncbi:hypothetical protein ACIA58_19485 [Kribbella sp. NPDC051586]|uniref:hypothetical protein n=1 Tax=Kribbella sp. NPDC051586 TaxID=3364118 RepID=UPI0037B6BFA1
MATAVLLQIWGRSFWRHFPGHRARRSRLPVRRRRHSIVGGAVLVTVALLGLALLTRAGTSDGRLSAIVVIAALASLGTGAMLPSLLGLTLSQVPPTNAVAVAQQFCEAAGVAVLGTVFFAAAGSPVDAGAGCGMAWVAGAGAALCLLIAACGIAGLRHRHAPRFRGALRRARLGDVTDLGAAASREGTEVPECQEKALSYGGRVALLFISLAVSAILFFAGIQVVVSAAAEARRCSGTQQCLSAQIDAGNATVFAFAGFAFAVVAAGFAITTWRRQPAGAQDGMVHQGPWSQWPSTQPPMQAPGGPQR